MLCLAFGLLTVNCSENKYSKEKNDPSGLKALDRPFRMGKVNAVWDKAKLVWFNKTLCFSVQLFDFEKLCFVHNFLILYAAVER
jgi:hypothetical protein